MPSIATETLSARVPNEVKYRFHHEAKARGITSNALLGQIVNGFLMKAGQGDDLEDGLLDDAPTELYGVALTLVDDLVRAGYPEGEIRTALNTVRSEML